MAHIFRDNHGNDVQPIDVVFPILTIDDNGFKFIGSGFFVHPAGGFVTAKHVMFDSKGKLIDPCYIIQAVKGKFIMRKLQVYFPSPVSDIGIGMLKGGFVYEDGSPFYHTPLAISLDVPEVGDIIKTFAYPKAKIKNIDETQIGDFKGDWQGGEIVKHYPNGRDKVLLPHNCYETSVLINGGASGGPVISNGLVIGVNSTGYDVEDGQKPISFITPISEIFNLPIHDSDGKPHTVNQLMKDGHIASMKKT